MIPAYEVRKVFITFICSLIKNGGEKQWTAVSLTLKQGIPRSDGTIQWLTRSEVEKCSTYLLKRLNEEIYGASVRRHGKKLFVVPSIERSVAGRLHVHLLLETPKHIEEHVSSYHSMIAGIWSELRWAQRQHDIRQILPHEVEWWTTYILKDLLSDDGVIDLKNLYLGEYV